jgi:error-prone DNA polymerase
VDLRSDRYAEFPDRSSNPASLRPSSLQLHTIPPEDPIVYDMIDNADTIGVFQIESRAQMSMLPRLRPRCFYDLVIEVAIVRPGPIQGDMVHPYLRRRNNQEPVEYPSEALRQVLGKTLGVPLFQEQAMKLVMVAAGFSAEEADKLRRSMAAWRRNGLLEQFHPKVVEGMLKNGYTREFAERCFQQIRGFGEYGFPESHAASFALLVYASAWLKCHHPAAFAAALLNSQPMGFYAPAQIVRDARDHGVEVRPVDINFSDWDCTLEESWAEGGRGDAETRGHGESIKMDSTTFTQHSAFSTRHSFQPSLRLGFRQIKSFREPRAQAITMARKHLGRFTHISQFHRATALPVSALPLLAEADAFGSMGLSRREALWQVTRLKNENHPLFDPIPQDAPCENENKPLYFEEPAVRLPRMSLGREVTTDYATTGLSLKRHPVALVRGELARQKILPAQQILQKEHGQWVRAAGLVLVRQRPGTASGVVFVTLEDETGIINLILHSGIYERYRPAARHAHLLEAHGYVQREGQVVHILAKRLFDRSILLTELEVKSRDFH